MKRLLYALAILIALCPPVRGAEVSGGVALTFDACSRDTLDVLERMGAKGTFFLREPQPEIAQELLEKGHEVGLSLENEPDVTLYSRRQIYGLLCARQEGFPKKYRPTWVRPPAQWGDGLVQVAKATRMSLLLWSRDARQRPDPAWMDHIRSGDVIALGDISPGALAELIQVLRSRHLEPMTVSELALELDADILPGRIYRKFPAGRRGI